MATTKVEMKKVVYKPDIYFEREGQVFPQYEDELKYDEKTDSLVKVGEIDIQERLNSYKETALDAMLDRFNFLGATADAISLDPDAVEDFYESPDLLDLAANKEYIEQMKLELGIPWQWTDEEVIAYIEAQKQNKDVKEEKKDATSDSEETK